MKHDKKSFKKWYVSLVVLLVLCIGIVIAFGMRKKSRKGTELLKLEGITRIEVRSGTSGKSVDITEKEIIEKLCDFFQKNEYEKVKLRYTSGWSYGFKFYNKEKEVEGITIKGRGRFEFNKGAYNVKNQANIRQYEEWIGTLVEGSKNDGVRFEIKEGSLSKTGCTIIIHNEREENLTFGSDYFLEKKTDGIWEELPYSINENDIGWNSIAYTILAKSSYELETINWEWLYGMLEPGTYRIVKTTKLEDKLSAPQYYFTAEFIME